jgi:hypothetical protein
MPRNVRNFWIELDVDGRKETLEAGPVSKTGGFSITIKMRNDGDIEIPVRINGFANDEGDICLSIIDESSGKEVFERKAKR